MSAEQPNRPTSSRSGMPMGSTVAIVVAAVAVLLGLLVLKKIIDDDDKGTTLPAVTTPLITEPPVVNDTSVAADTTPVVSDTTGSAGGVTAGTKTGATLQVANASNQGGVAKLASSLLKDDGFTTAEPVSTATKLEKTIVYYAVGDADAEAVATTVAARICAGDPQELPTAYVTDPKLGTTTAVVVALGNDKAGKTLAKMCASTTKSTTADTTASATDGTTG